MTAFFRFLKNNRGVIGMLFFVAVFYALLAFGGEVYKKALSSDASSPAVSLAKNEPALSDAQDFKKKEEEFKKNILQNAPLANALSLIFLAVFISAIVVDIRILSRISKTGKWVEHGTALAEPLWGVREVFFVSIFMFFFEAVIVLGEIFYFSIFKNPGANHDLLLMSNSLLRDMAVTVLILWIVQKKLGQGAEVLGLSPGAFWKNIKTGLWGYLAALPILLLSLVILSGIIQLLAYEPAPQNVVQIYLKKSTDPYILYFTLFVAGLGPVIEEIFFRGFAYRAFRKKWGFFGASAATSVVFAAFHMNIVAFLPIFVLSMFLCYLYEETGSLIPSMTAHMLHNLIMVSCTLGFKSMVG